MLVQPHPCTHRRLTARADRVSISGVGACDQVGRPERSAHNAALIAERSCAGGLAAKNWAVSQHQRAPRRFSQAVPRLFYPMAGGWAAHLGSAGLLRASAQAHSAAAPRTGRAFVDKLDPSSLKRGHDLR
jgi:hypothetical protein